VGPYAEGWKRYRKFRRRQLIVWLLIFFCIAIGAILPHGVISQQWPGSEWLVAILITGMFLFWIVSAIRLQLFRCPRCGERFSGTWWYNLSFLARKCVHCKLPKFSDDGS
jgi:hypothetical protein